jgi:hypothetical protein
MLAVAGFAVSCLLVLGFYGHVFMQLYREHQRFKAQEKRLDEHLCAMEPEVGIKGRSLKTSTGPKVPRHTHKETLIHVGVAIGGLVSVFAEIVLLNWLVTSFH